jgi:hypothetical protein
MKPTKMIMTIAFAVIIAGCGVRKERISIINGVDGKDGANGHSLVSEYKESEECINGGTRLDIYIDLDDSFSVSEGDLEQGSLIACNGSRGIQGLIGLQGVVGATGSIGPQGLTGAIGPQGARGASGQDGTVGSAGAQGVAGPVGPAGAQGPAGAAGAQGLQGVIGLTGGTTNVTNNVVNASILVTLSGCNPIAGTQYYSKDNQVYEETGCDSDDKVAKLTGADDTFWVASNKLAVQFTSSNMKIITFN